MRFLLLAMLASFLTPAFAIEPSENDRIEFGDATYKRVHASSSKGTVINEFVPENESLERWSSMVTIQKHEGFDSIDEFLKRYLKKVKPLLAKDVEYPEYDYDGAEEEKIVEVFLMPESKEFIEYNLIRFVHDTESKVLTIYFYAHAYKPDVDAASEAASEDLEDRIDALINLDIEVEDSGSDHGE